MFTKRNARSKSVSSSPTTFDAIHDNELQSVVSARGKEVFPPEPEAKATRDQTNLEIPERQDQVQQRGVGAGVEGVGFPHMPPRGEIFEPPFGEGALREPEGGISLGSGGAASFDPNRPASSGQQPPPPQPPPELPIVGLALSGGGIRSATFSLGVLQLIAARGHLRSIDYVSSVSGGGYIASWLSAWITRSGIATVETKLARSPETSEREPDEVMWLRRYSNYLTPRVGALSLDALTVIATYLRNVLLNIIILVFSVAALLALPIALLPLIVELTRFPTACSLVGLIIFLVSFSFVAVNLTIKHPDSTSTTAAIFRSTGVFWLVVIPAFVASLCTGIWVLTPYEHTYPWWIDLALSLSTLFFVVGIAWAIALEVARRRKIAASLKSPADANAVQPDTPPGATGRNSDEPTFKDVAAYVICAIAAACVGVGLVMIFQGIFEKYFEHTGTAPANWEAPVPEAAAIFLFAPAAILVCLGISTSIYIGLVGRQYADGSREWFARTGGTFLLTSLIWIAWLGLAFYVPTFIPESAQSLAGSWLKGSAFVTWLLSLIGSMIITRVRGREKSEEGSTSMTTLATVLATIVAAGLFVMIAMGLHAVLAQLQSALADANHAEQSLSAYARSPGNGLPSVAFIFTAGAAAVAFIFAWRVDINRFSLHDMYKNRLIRCYLGASNQKRDPQPFVGFDLKDDMLLTELPQRPYHIINTALNLVQGSELAWQERKAASFVFTRDNCGFQLSRVQGNTPVRESATPLPGMRPTQYYASNDPQAEWQGVTLGTAMAVSGAAVSPNMGFHSQPALAALMTFFNIRLGRWCPNPAGPAWESSSPAFGLLYLLAELTGYTNERSKFVYLSDGGHFENTAVYELVRRRCAHILVVDAGADPKRCFEDLANMLRKCRVDFGIDFELGTSNLYAGENGPRSKSGFVEGKIFYGQKGDKPAFVGRILIIKPSLQNPPRETTDIYSYAKRAITFPQQTTIDQWFDESQFESYRKLGYSLAAAALDVTEESFFPLTAPSKN
ncbi:patatin-like phospholipase family protein [Rudaea sp.]|uniref:patatin-like phospholipase family protein n=1 Tax=Rudaea sp. TaxID=2136325 RepID=UPI003785167D